MLTIEKPRSKSKTIGPADHGRRMSLDDFDRCQVQPGFLYELSKGVIDVSDVPGLEHFRVWELLRDLFVGYKLQHPDIITSISGGGESKLLIEPDDSERHPDLSVYLTPIPQSRDLWSIWKPALVVEIVSERSRKRDLEDKPAEYLAFGVDEYWAVDAEKNVVVVHQRFRGDWRIASLTPGKKLKSRQFPGLVIDVRKLIAAGKLMQK